MDEGERLAGLSGKHEGMASALALMEGPELTNDDFRWFVRIQIRQHRTAALYYRQLLAEWLDRNNLT